MQLSAPLPIPEKILFYFKVLTLLCFVFCFILYLFFAYTYVLMLIDTGVEFVPWLITADSKILELMSKCGEAGGTEKAL